MGKDTDNALARRALVRPSDFVSVAVGVGVFCSAARDPLRSWLEMGIGGPLTAAAAIGALVVLRVLARMDARSLVRHALIVLATSLPLIVSFAGFAWGLSKTIEVAATADIGDVILTVGLAEATNCLVLGAALTAGLAFVSGATLGVESKDREAGLAIVASLAALATFACATSFVLAVFANDVSSAQLFDPQNEHALQLIGVERFRTWMLNGAIGTACVSMLAVALTARASMSADSRAATVVTSLAVGAVMAVSLGGLAVADRVVVAHRVEGFARHLDAFEPLTFSGSLADPSGAVVVPGLIVGTAGRGPIETESLRRVANADDAFAIDRRVSPADLRALVDGLVASGKASIHLLGVMHREAELARIRRVVATPFAGSSLPLTASLEVNLGVPEDTIAGRALRTTVRAGGAPSIATSDGVAVAEVAEADEVVFVVLGVDATPRDLVNTLGGLRKSGFVARLVSSTATLPTSAPPGPATRLHDVDQVADLLGGLGGLGLPPPTPVDPAAAAAVPPTELSRDAIRAAFLAIRPATSRCYERALRDDPSVAGRALVDVTIRRGAATRAEVTSDTLPASVMACLERAVRAARFPDAGDESETQVRFPFTFQSAGN